MPTLVDRSEAVSALQSDWESLASLVATLTEPQWAMPTCLPGWTVRDVVSHVVGTEAMLLGESAPSVELTSRDHVRNPIGEANEQWVVAMRPLSGAELRARLESVTRRRLEALEAMTQADFDAPSWTPAGRDETYGRFMRIRHFDCFMHENDILDALALPLREDPAGLRPVLAEIETGLGYVVGRRAQLPDGTRVRFDLVGPVSATYFVQVDGRATVVPELDGPPTVGLELPVWLFVRLAGGRADGARSVDQVRISGDRGLGEQLVANLAFTI